MSHKPPAAMGRPKITSNAAMNMVHQKPKPFRSVCVETCAVIGPLLGFYRGPNVHKPPQFHDYFDAMRACVVSYGVAGANIGRWQTIAALLSPSSAGIKHPYVFSPSRLPSAGHFRSLAH